MGRFSLNEDNDDCWEFVANTGEEGALIVKETTQSNERQNLYDPSPDSAVIATSPSLSRPKSFLHKLRNLSLLVILLSYVLQRYLPPAPPPLQDDTTISTWTEFLTHHSFQLLQSLAVLTVHVPFHISHWIVHTVSTDLQIAYERYHESHCRFRPLTSVVLQRHITGQPLAVPIVADTIETWSRTAPLFLFFTGFPHTGQTTLAKAVMEELFGDCSDRDKRILSIRAQDLMQPRDWQQMTQHVQYYTSGAMIVIQDFDDLDLLPLLRADDDSWTPHTIVIVCSHTIGRPAIARALRQGQFQYRNTALWDDLRRHVPEDWDAVIPFQPLTRETLGEVVSMKISRLAGNKVKLTDRFLNVWLDQVEYLEWKRRDTPADEPVPFMTVALKGAQILDDSPLWKRFAAGWNRCLKEKVSQMDYREGDIVLHSDEGRRVCSFSLV